MHDEDWTFLKKHKNGIPGQVKNDYRRKLWNMFYGNYFEENQTGKEVESYLSRAKTIISKLEGDFSFELFAHEISMYGKDRKTLENRKDENNIIASLKSIAEAMSQQGRIGNATSYLSAAASLSRFVSSLTVEQRYENLNYIAPKGKAVAAEDLVIKFEHLIPQMLALYERWMLRHGKAAKSKKGKAAAASLTTVGIYGRHIRSVFNDAIEKGIVNRDLYPFSKNRYTIPAGTNTKKALTKAEVLKIMDYQCAPGMEQRSRDLWVFSYLCNGMNINDICRLKWEDIQSYLLGTLLLATLVPMVQFSEPVYILPQQAADVTFSYSALPINEPVEPGLDWGVIVAGIYLAGLSILLFNFLKGLFGLNKLISSALHIPMDGFTLVLPANQPVERSGSFSFFKYMVVSPNDYENHFETISNHEAVHIRQLHSLDILLIEILRIVFWFNPALWLYKMALRETHEFLADEEAQNKDGYAAFLISYAKHAPIRSISNQFFNSALLKKRIYTIYTDRTPYWMRGKYLLIAPVIALMALLFAAQASTAPMHLEEQLKQAQVRRFVPQSNVETDQQKTIENKTAVKPSSKKQLDRSVKYQQTDSVPQIGQLLPEMKKALVNDDLENARRLSREINRLIWKEKTAVKVQKTEAKLRSSTLETQKEQSIPDVLIGMSNQILAFSEDVLNRRTDNLYAVESEFDEMSRELTNKSKANMATQEQATQKEIVKSLIEEGIVTNSGPISYRLHNMFLIVNGVEQPDSVHQRYKAKYLKNTWTEWVYNWEGLSGHRINGVRSSGK